MDQKRFILLILAILLVANYPKMANAQENLKTVGEYQYAQYKGTWYSVVNGKQGDLMDTKHIIVRSKDKSDIEKFDFQGLSVPQLKDVRGEFADGFYELEIPEGYDGFEIADKLEKSGKFDELLFNVFIEVDANPNDQYYGSQWGLTKINISSAWDITVGVNSVIVAVIDVGSDYNHQDLVGNKWSGTGYDFYDNDSDPYPDDEAGHGTAVAGILGAVTNNSMGVSGVAGGWAGNGGIRIMHLDAGYIDAYGDEWIDLSASAQAIDSAAVWGAKVINMSFGSYYGYTVWQSAINRVVNNYDVLCVASAGNYKSGGATNVRYPAAYSNVIAVGATTPNDTRKELNDGTEYWWGSCYGSQLEVMAPGVYIYTTDLTGSIGYSTGNYCSDFNGTSSAAPHVAGLAALIRSINPSLTWQEVRETIRTSADTVEGMGGQNFHNEYGYGRINAYNTLLNTPIIVNLSTAQFLEGGSGGTYEVNSVNVGSSWSGTAYYGQTLKANPPGGWSFYQWSDGSTANPRTITQTLNIYAIYKGIHKSNTTTAWDNTSQRKLIQTLAGGNTWLHQVYTSAGHVWIEHSGNGGSTWTLGNNGQPLDGTAGGKCPSIAYATHDQGYAIDNYIGVVWQEKDGTHYKIKGKIFNQYGDVNLPPSPYYEVTTLFTEPNDTYDGVNANPNLVMAKGYASPYLVTFERKSTSGSLQPGINWLVGHTEDSGQRYLGPFGLSEEQGIITGTNANTTNVQLSIWPNTNMLDINLVQQAGATGAIYSHWISLYENLGNWNYYQFDDGMISYPSANKSPSITSLPNCLYSACWIEVQNMAFYYLGNPSVRYYYGVYGSSCSINRGGGSSSSGFAVWSQQPSSGTKLNKSIRFDGGYPVSSSIQTLSTTGKYVQVGNGATSNHSNMYVSSFYPNSLPYYFSTSQTLGPLSKSSPKIVEGRGFIIKKGDAYFKYNLEGLNVDGQNIAFVDASDEVDYSKIDNLNDVLLTEPFQLKEDSKVIFMEESGFADSIVASKAFGKEGYIHYKVELIDETTGNIVGIIKNVNFNASNVHITQKPTYSLNTKGLDSKIVRAKITLETNLVGENSGKPTTTAQDLSHIPPAIREKRLNIKNPNIILTKSYSEENISLAKAIFEQLELEKPDIPISYSLAQNYPNPFNPTTTISYALPKAGNVTITVYNLLGEEVATLVKGERQEGRHSVTFDGSLLSSGTYLVRMHSGNYSKTIKILLIK